MRLIPLRIGKKVERLQMCIAKVTLEFVMELLGVPKRLIPLKCLSRMMGNYHVRFLGGVWGGNAPALPDVYHATLEERLHKLCNVKKYRLVYVRELN